MNDRESVQSFITNIINPKLFIYYLFKFFANLNTLITTNIICSGKNKTKKIETGAVYGTGGKPIESTWRTSGCAVYARLGRKGNTAKRHFLECFSLPHRPQRYAGHFCLSRLWGLLASGKLQLIPNFISPRDQSGGRCPAHDRARRCDASSPDGFSPSERTRLRGTLFSPLRSSSLFALSALFAAGSLLTTTHRDREPHHVRGNDQLETRYLDISICSPNFFLLFPFLHS